MKRVYCRSIISSLTYSGFSGMIQIDLSFLITPLFPRNSMISKERLFKHVKTVSHGSNFLRASVVEISNERPDAIFIKKLFLVRS